MNRCLILISYLIAFLPAHSQTVQNPVADMAEIGRATGVPAADRIYFEWLVDINHDGITDALLTLKPSQSEIKEHRLQEGKNFNPSECAFGVYLGERDGGYVRNRSVEDGDGEFSGGIGIDLSRCFVGYIDDLKRYGIVTVDSKKVGPLRGRGDAVFERQVYCYTVEGDHIKRKNLGPPFDAETTNPLYEKYLSDRSRRHVVLKEITP